MSTLCVWNYTGYWILFVPFNGLDLYRTMMLASCCGERSLPQKSETVTRLCCFPSCGNRRLALRLFQIQEASSSFFSQPLAEGRQRMQRGSSGTHGTHASTGPSHLASSTHMTWKQNCDLGYKMGRFATILPSVSLWSFGDQSVRCNKAALSCKLWLYIRNVASSM